MFTNDYIMRMIEQLIIVRQKGYHCVRLDGDGDVADVCRLTCLEQGIDIILQKTAGRRKKALLADMESTLIKEEMLEELADFVGLRAKVEAGCYHAD